MKHETEAVYDDRMAPLIEKLIVLAREHGIPLLVHAGMVMDDGTPGGCITLVNTSVVASLEEVVSRHRLAASVCTPASER